MYKMLAKDGMRINCTSLDQIRLLGATGIATKCSIRINPGEGHGANNKTNTGGPSNKHGIYKDQVDEARRLADKLGIQIDGVHAHIGSGGDSIDEWLRIKDKSLKIARAFPDLQFVNLGGGLPVVYDESKDKPIDFRAWGAALSETMEKFSESVGRAIQLQIQPGRYLVAHSGTLLAKVQSVKRTPKYNFVTVNTGMNHNPCPAMYGAFHPISFIPATRRRSPQTLDYVVAGYLCESGDVFTLADGDGKLAPRKFSRDSR